MAIKHHEVTTELQALSFGFRPRLFGFAKEVAAPIEAADSIPRDSAAAEASSLIRDPTRWTRLTGPISSFALRTHDTESRFLVVARTAPRRRQREQKEP